MGLRLRVPEMPYPAGCHVPIHVPGRASAALDDPFAMAVAAWPPETREACCEKYKLIFTLRMHLPRTQRVLALLPPPRSLLTMSALSQAGVA